MGYDNYDLNQSSVEELLFHLDYLEMIEIELVKRGKEPDELRSEILRIQSKVSELTE